MKKIIYSLFCFIILILINFLVAKFFKVDFLEVSFITGLASSAGIVYFSSEGGPSSNMADMQFKHLLSSEARTNNYFTKFEINIPFLVALVYTILSAIVSIVAYWKYF